MKLRQASLGSEVPNMLAALPFADGAEGAEMSIPLFDMTRWPAPAGDCREWLLLVYRLATRAGRKCDTSVCVYLASLACVQHGLSDYVSDGSDGRREGWTGLMINIVPRKSQPTMPSIGTQSALISLARVL